MAFHYTEMSADVTPRDSHYSSQTLNNGTFLLIRVSSSISPRINNISTRPPDLKRWTIRAARCWPRVKGDPSKEKARKKETWNPVSPVLQIFDSCLKKKKKKIRNEEFVGGRIKGWVYGADIEQKWRKEGRPRIDDEFGCAQTGRRPRPLRELHFNRSLY